MISVAYEAATMPEIFSDIASKTPFSFVYDGQDVDAMTPLTLRYDNQSVADVLIEVSRLSGLGFKQVNNSIYVKNRHTKSKSRTVEVVIDQPLSGKVTDQESGDPLPGVNVLAKGTTVGTVTDIDGNYRFTVNDEVTTLVFSSIGYEAQEVEVGGRSTINVTLVPDVQKLEELVVTGVVTGTPKKKLGFAVEKIEGDLLQNVPATNVASSLAGKVPGLKISAGSSAPGSNPDIQLRNATTIFGSSNPLIIVDGVLTEGNLSDINVEDIASIEVVKGAAAASLYGSRASNGVVNITTKRGTGLNEGSSEVIYRTEFGQSFIPFVPQKTKSINVAVNENQVDYDSPSPDGVYDNPYPKLTDPVDQFFNPGRFMTHYLAFRGNSNQGKTAVFSSVQYTDEAGVVKLADGRQRTNFRLNLDHNVTDKLKFSASNLFARNIIDNRADGIWDMFYYADPDVDLLQPNDDGTPYKVNPNRINPRLANPLYNIYNTINNTDRNRFIGNYRVAYDLLDNLQISAAYGLDRIESNSFGLNPKGLLRADNPDLRQPGSIFESTSNTFAQTLQADALYFRQWGDFNAKFRLQYLHESNEVNAFSGSGTHLAVLGKDVRSLEQASEDINLSSTITSVVANNYSSILQLDYKEKYIFDGLFRRDGVSLFGPNERWQNFYRISGAWRITEDMELPGVQELKLRSSYGVAGLRPPYSAQYDVLFLTNGTINPGEDKKETPI